VTTVRRSKCITAQRVSLVDPSSTTKRLVTLAMSMAETILRRSKRMPLLESTRNGTRSLALRPSLAQSDFSPFCLSSRENSRSILNFCYIYIVAYEYFGS